MNAYFLKCKKDTENIDPKNNKFYYDDYDNFYDFFFFFFVYIKCI